MILPNNLILLGLFRCIRKINIFTNSVKYYNISKQIFKFDSKSKNTNMYQIKKAAVLGSGVMGSGIAAHLANIGIEVLLLDIVPFNLTDEQKKVPAMRNKLANAAVKAALKSKRIEPFYDKKFASRVSTGNFEDDMAKISDSDWIIEVVVERLDIKKQVFDNIEKHRKPGSLITSNTSGIPIHMMLDGRSEDFKKHFCGTHFFNPPRYLKLLEIIPTEDTAPDVTEFFTEFGTNVLGKGVVIAKDSPNFIGNRLLSITGAFATEYALENGYSVAEVDNLTGQLMGRPKTGTFRLTDVIGVDVLNYVAENLYVAIPDDKDRDVLRGEKSAAFTQALLNNKWLGNKTGQGFWKKGKDENGKRACFTLNPETLEYELPPREIVERHPDKFASTKVVYNKIDVIKKRLSRVFENYLDRCL